MKKNRLCKFLGFALAGVIALTSVEFPVLANEDFQWQNAAEERVYENNEPVVVVEPEEWYEKNEESELEEFSSDSCSGVQEVTNIAEEETVISGEVLVSEDGEPEENPIEGEENPSKENPAEGEENPPKEETVISDWGDVTQEDQLLYATEEFPLGDVSKIPDGMWIAGIKKEGYFYSGEQIVFESETETELRVYDGKKLLRAERDYTITYKNNKNVYQLTEEEAGYNAKKAPTVILTGKGNYSGTITKTFTINPLDLSATDEEGNPKFQVENVTLAYNGKVQKGTPKVTYTDASGKTVTLKVKKDFTYSYPGTQTGADYDPAAFKEATETPYTGLVIGCGNYTGSLEFQQKITASILISKAKVSAVKPQSYTGEAIEPQLTLQYKGEKLTEYNEETGTGDYTVSYENNIKTGTASAVIHGKGKFAGTRKVTFKINGIELKKAKVEGFQNSYVYTGEPVFQETVKISFNNGNETVIAQENTHYTAEYIHNTAVGSATVIYRGIEENGWSGTIKKKFKITPYDLNSDLENRILVLDSFGVNYPVSLAYVKGGVKPQPEIIYSSPSGEEYFLEEGTDYKLSYNKNKNLYEGSDESKMAVIKITGKGNFKGTRQKEKFRICRQELGKLHITAADKAYQNKKGNYQTVVTITDADGKKLKAGTDYEKEVRYYYEDDVILENGTYRECGEPVDKKDLVPVGTELRAEVTGKGNYEGCGPVSYRIVKSDISKAIVRISKQYYTGEEICPDKNEIVILLNGKVLNEEDYEIVSYSDNINKGNGKLTIKGIGNYGGRKTVNFTIANKSMFYMISFHPNGATSGTMKDLRLWYNKSYSLTKNNYQRIGHKFIGWNTKSDGSGTDDQGNKIIYSDRAKDPIQIGKEDMGKTKVLYAQWEMETYKITYKLNGGANHEENPAVYTVKDEIQLKDPAKKGYIFMGWYTDSKCSESKKLKKISIGSAGNLVLYAKWRETFVGEVQKPEEGTYLNVRDFGAIPDDSTDDTNAIEKAIREASYNYSEAKAALEEQYGEEAKNMKVEAVHTVYLPEGTYHITPGHAYNDGDPGIGMRSNVNLIMDSKAILKVAPSSYEDYCVISIKNVENIKIQGGVIQGERYRHKGNAGEYGHGVALYGGRNIEISDMVICSNWGDGVYLGTQPVLNNKYVGCDKITIKNCDIYDNRRSNISVTDADNLTIEHCLIYDAHGTAPQCGICIEPNSNSSGDKICRNIVLKDTTITAYQNNEYYMCFMTHYNPYISGYTTADGIWFKNCVFNGYVGNYSGNNLHYDAKTKFNGEFDNHR